VSCTFIPGLSIVYPSPSKADINTIKSSCQNLREFLMKERMQPEKKPHFLASIRLTVFFSLNKKKNIKLSHPFCTIVPPSLRFTILAGISTPNASGWKKTLWQKRTVLHHFE